MFVVPWKPLDTLELLWSILGGTKNTESSALRERTSSSIEQHLKQLSKCSETDFDGWFHELVSIEVQSKHYNLSSIISMDSVQTRSQLPKQQATDPKQDSSHIEDTKRKMIAMIIDSLGFNHLDPKGNKINEKDMCSLGRGDNLDPNRIEKLIETIISELLSKKIIKNHIQKNKNRVATDNKNINTNNNEDPENFESDDTKEDDFESDDPEGALQNIGDIKTPEEVEFIDQVKFYLQKEVFLSEGFLLNKDYLSTIIDCIKCRGNIDDLIKFSFGPNNRSIFQLVPSELIILLLEISDPVVHKKIVSSAVEQHIPIPISYAMMEIKTIERDISLDYYLRDILHLASQSKLISDGMTSNTVERDYPLVMFVGSNNVKQGKSTMLNDMYENMVNFNAIKHNKTPLHSTSVDLIYLPKDCNAKYHILDVHGQIKDPFFMQCVGNNVSRVDILGRLAKLCRCIVLQIDSRKELSTSFVKKCAGGYKFQKFDINDVISTKKGKGKEILQLYETFKVCVCFSLFFFCFFFTFRIFRSSQIRNLHFHCDVYYLDRYFFLFLFSSHVYHFYFLCFLLFD